VPIATALVAGPAIGPILLPIMLYHPMQLVVCTWIVRFFGQRSGTGTLATPCPARNG